LLAPKAQHLFGAWSIADADLSLALMRLAANGDPLPARLSEYALAQWNRPSIRKYLSYVPTNRLK
jgi:glutathione S-transferase